MKVNAESLRIILIISTRRRQFPLLYDNSNKIFNMFFSLHLRFSSCVNETMQRGYNLRARLYNLEYCKTSASKSGGPLSVSEKGFAAALAAVLALAVVSTTLDFTLSDDARKGKH